MSQHSVEWLDFGREPRCAPDPTYPNGKDVDASGGAERTCVVPLPYPAPRCGVYSVGCPVCKFKVAVTTAGRSDDPRSITIACHIGATA